LVNEVQTCGPPALPMASRRQGSPHAAKVADDPMLWAPPVLWAPLEIEQIFARMTHDFLRSIA
jgi:hypothetical protein